MAKRTKHKRHYSSAERKAYYMGYGAGVCGVDINSINSIDLIDDRQGAGQRPELCKSARRGFVDGRKNKGSVHFEKGFKKYPVSKSDWLKK